VRKESCTAVVVAAGSASRMRGIDKTVASIGGIPMILRTVQALSQSDRIDEIVVVTRQDLIETICTLCKDVAKFRTAVVGGKSRTESVLSGITDANGTLVAIHDGARPFVTQDVIDRAIEAAEQHGAAAPAIAVKDTIKVARDSRICHTPDRSELFAVQTPQVFYKTEILNALQTALAQNLNLTDDCSAFEAMGKTVILTEGSDENIKITTPIDLAFGEAILKRRDAL